MIGTGNYTTSTTNMYRLHVLSAGGGVFVDPLRPSIDFGKTDRGIKPKIKRPQFTNVVQGVVGGDGSGERRVFQQHRGTTTTIVVVVVVVGVVVVVVGGGVAAAGLVVEQGAHFLKDGKKFNQGDAKKALVLIILVLVFTHQIKIKKYMFV